MPKILLLVLVTALASAISTAVAMEFLRDERAPAPAPEPRVAAVPASLPGPAAVPAAKASLLPPADPQVAERLSALEARLDRIETERASARVPVEAARPDAAALALPPGTDPRSFVLDVLAEERVHREQEETELWEARSDGRLRRTAAWAGEELGLAPQEQEALLGILREESFRRNEIFRTLRESAPDSPRDGAHGEFEELRRWKETELVAKFGPTVAQSLLDLERERGGPMRPFDFTRGDFPPGGFGSRDWNTPRSR